MRTIILTILLIMVLTSCYHSRKISNTIFLISRNEVDFVLKKSKGFEIYRKNYYIDSNKIDNDNKIIIHKHDELIWNGFNSITHGLYYQKDFIRNQWDSIILVNDNGLKTFNLTINQPVCNWYFEERLTFQKIECFLWYDDYCFQKGTEYDIYTFCNGYFEIPKYPKWYLKYIVFFSIKSE